MRSCSRPRVVAGSSAVVGWVKEAPRYNVSCNCVGMRRDGGPQDGLRCCGLKGGLGALVGWGWGYLLLLAGHKGLVARRCPEAQLVDGGRLLLAVDLHSDPHLKQGLLCRGKGDPEACVSGHPLLQPSLPRTATNQRYPLLTGKDMLWGPS